MIDFPSFTVPVVRFVRNEVEKSSLYKTKMKERSKELPEAVGQNSIKVEEGMLTKCLARLDSQAPYRKYSTARRPIRRRRVQKRL